LATSVERHVGQKRKATRQIGNVSRKSWKMVERRFGPEKKVLPDYPSVKHLPWKPNVSRDDKIVSEEEAAVIFQGHDVYVEEKIDGANCGMAKVRNFPIIRNIDHILRKGYTKPTPAKIQFRPIWNYYYDNESRFDKLNETLGPVSVYGEWMVARHGLEYDQLPDWFVAYDVYDYDRHEMIDPQEGRTALQACGFSVVPLLAINPTSYEELEALCQQPSEFTTLGLREGIFVKVGDGKRVTHSFKMVREGFVQGALWDKKKLNKNRLKS